jgi:hypothetical protein
MPSGLPHHPYGNGINAFALKHSKQSSIGQASPGVGERREEDSSLILNLNLRFFGGV